VTAEPDPADQARVAAIASDPRFALLVRQRSRFAWLLAAIVTGVYCGYILAVAFDKPLLATPIGGGVTSLGIPVGIGIIVLSVALTGVYVRRANRTFDAQVAALVADHAQ
jgi:uncharacterized membrane protein (DUF485 family)